jgi:hypothetical protein
MPGGGADMDIDITIRNATLEDLQQIFGHTPITNIDTKSTNLVVTPSNDSKPAQKKA